VDELSVVDLIRKGRLGGGEQVPRDGTPRALDSRGTPAVRSGTHRVCRKVRSATAIRLCLVAKNFR